MGWIELAGNLIKLVLVIIDANKKGQIDQATLDLIVKGLKEPLPPK